MNIKTGIRLPKTKCQWTEANAYFHVQFAPLLSSRAADIDSDIIRAQDVVYDYFASSCGTVTMENNIDYKTKYESYSIKLLKQALRSLKNAQPSSDTSEVRYVSALIRSRLIKYDQVIGSACDAVDLDRNLKLRFWTTCRELFNRATNSLPTFDMSQYYNYFKSTATSSSRSSARSSC